MDSTQIFASYKLLSPEELSQRQLEKIDELNKWSDLWFEEASSRETDVRSSSKEKRLNQLLQDCFFRQETTAADHPARELPSCAAAILYG